MKGVNLVVLVGHTGGDPEVRYLPNGSAIATVSLATSEKWKDKDGNPQERTEWSRCKFFGKLAEIVGEYVKKGDPIYVQGSLRTDKYTDKAGVERYTTDIICNQMQMLGSKKDRGERSGGSDAPTQAPSRGAADPEGFDDDIPFISRAGVW
jgi:single-strand DNA-binding protein